MHYHLCQDIGRERHNPCSYLPSFDNMEWMPNTGHKYFCVKVIVSKDLNDFLYKGHAILSCVVQSSYKWAYIRSTSFSSQYGLIGREDERHVSRYAIQI